MQFSEEYPNKPPVVRFVSKMFHPNGKGYIVGQHYMLVLIYRMFSVFLVYADGSICLDILQNRWSPTYDVSSILTSIQVNRQSWYESIVVHSVAYTCTRHNLGTDSLM